jgi:hypothetical protein
VLRKRSSAIPEADARLMAHATFGLLNSTPHSMKSPDVVGSTPAREAHARAVMRAMTVTALSVVNNLPAGTLQP